MSRFPVIVRTALAAALLCAAPPSLEGQVGTAGVPGAVASGAVASGAVASGAVAAAPAAGGEARTLVPAAFGIWTDRSGSSWSVEAAGNIGRIGSAMVNSGLVLSINEEKFVAYQPMMTPDGRELVLQSLPFDAFPGLRVQRRIRLLDDPGGLRYAELLHNDSADAISVTLGLGNSFSGNFRTFVSDRGRSEPLLLGDSETGVLVVPGASQSSRAFLFTLAGSDSRVRPTVSSQNRYALAFRYQVDLAPGETAVVAHHVAQIATPQTFDRRTLLRLVRPYSLERIRDSFSPDWSTYVINADEGREASTRALFEAGGIAALGMAPGPRDVLAAGSGTRLPGAVEGGPLRLDSPYGEAEIPMESVAALVGRGGRGDGRSRVFLRDGQVFSSGFSASGLGFVPEGGGRVDLADGRFERVLMAGAGLVPSWPEKVLAFVETREGDRIAVTEGGAIRMGLATTWGIVKIEGAELLRLGATEEPLGFRAEFANGSRLVGIPEGDALVLEGTLFGRIEIPTHRVSRIFTRAGMEPSTEIGASEAATVVSLSGGQVLVGAVAETSLAVSVEGTLIELALADLRQIARADGGLGGTGSRWDEPRFRFERWDGGIVFGVARIDALSLGLGGASWRLPLRDIASVEFSPPLPGEEAVGRIEALVRDLGSADWGTREAASRELGAFGYLARSVLRRKLRDAEDPEVVRRLEQILSAPN